MSSVLLNALTIIILRHSLAASSAYLRLLWVSSRVAHNPRSHLPLVQKSTLSFKHVKSAQHAFPPCAIIVCVVI
jgi:hypothetical protein